MIDEHDTMAAKHTRKQQKLASNDGSLDTKRQQLQAAQADLSDAQTFLRTLLDMCSAKAKQYNSRLELRRKEEVALAEAISILNTDSAFATFGWGRLTPVYRGEQSKPVLHWKTLLPLLLLFGLFSFSKLSCANRKRDSRSEKGDGTIRLWCHRPAELLHLRILRHFVASHQAVRCFHVFQLQSF